MRGICLPILFLGLPSETLDSLRVMFEKLCLVTRGLRPNVPIALCKSSPVRTRRATGGTVTLYTACRASLSRASMSLAQCNSHGAGLAIPPRNSSLI